MSERPGPARSRPDVACVGETMAMVVPMGRRGLARGSPLSLDVGGAESNVACSLAALGHRAAWVGRVGADPFGEMVVSTLRECGVDVDDVEIDPRRPTGVYVKEPSPHGTRVHYYRQGSAASAMEPRLATVARLHDTRLVHLSGITAALSTSCRALVDALLLGRPPGGPLRSFDVNYRPGLWSRDEAAPILLRLARAADIVFVGLDEAQQVWGCASADEVRTLLPDVAALVVKDGAHGATCYEGRDCVYVPALSVEVVEPVGGGDAYAAGYLSGLLDGLDTRSRLRRGHLVAIEALAVAGDLPVLPHRDRLDRHLDMAPEEWLRFRPRGHRDAEGDAV